MNRLYEGKDFGYIIDYCGVLKRLDEALDLYSSLAEFDAVISPTLRVPEPSSSGVDISLPLWDGAPLPALDKGQFYFVEIPASQRPESVLESLARLRA